MGVWYCTREDVKSAGDIKLTARMDVQVDSAIDAASRLAEGLLLRPHGFAPVHATRHFSWPPEQPYTPWRLWLDDSDLISVTSIASGGVTIVAADYFLEPANLGPPYRSIEIDLASSASFQGGDTAQRNVVITGLWGYRNDETSVGTTTEALDTSETDIDVSAGVAAATGVGSVLRINSERMIVTERRFVDTTEDTAASIDASAGDTGIDVTDGGAFMVGEVIQVGAEQMLVHDIVGNLLTVKRAWNGTVLAAHNSGVNVSAVRTLVVLRAQLGTTAASHSSADAVHRWDPPSLLRKLVVAEAISTLQHELAGYGRTVGSGESEREASGAALQVLRENAIQVYGRQMRTRAV